MAGDTTRPKPVALSFAATLAVFLRSRWTGVEHLFEQANPRRGWEMIGNGEPACYLFAGRTPERDRLAYFTDVLLTPPPGVIVRRDKLAALPRDAAGEVDLPRLLADRRLRGAINDGRSYGDYINAQLRAAPADANLKRYSANDFGRNIPEMLVKGRADYGFGWVRAAELGSAAGQVVGAPVAGNTELVHAGIACPRTSWGLTVIRQVDALFATPDGQALVHLKMNAELPPATRQRHAAEIAAFYRDLAKPPPR